MSHFSYIAQKHEWSQMKIYGDTTSNAIIINKFMVVNFTIPIYIIRS